MEEVKKTHPLIVDFELAWIQKYLPHLRKMNMVEVAEKVFKNTNRPKTICP
jgi:hypothetical protein